MTHLFQNESAFMTQFFLYVYIMIYDDFTQSKVKAIINNFQV